MGTHHFRIKGSVITKDTRRPLHGFRVEAWDKDLIVDDFVGRVERTDADGRFEIAFDESYFLGLFNERTPDLFFRVFRGDKLVAETQPLIHKLGVDKTAGHNAEHVLEVEICIDYPFTEADPSHFRVTGCVRQANGRFVPQSLVRAFVRRDAKDQPLGEALTDYFGHFAISYTLDRRDSIDAGFLNLVLLAFDSDGTMIGSAYVAVAPMPEEIVNIIIGYTGKKTVEGRLGQVINNCQIDLPPDDVIEQVEFERFFRLNRLYGDFVNSPSLSEIPTLPSPPDSTNILTLPLALYFPFVQTWKLEGYTRGRLVKSFSLGPGEEQTVELFTWDRTRSSLESSLSFDQDQSTESSSNRRDTLDVTKDVVKQTGLEMTTGGKVGFQIGVVNVDMNSTVGAKTAINEAEKSTRNSIVDATSKASNHVRTSRTLKVTESRESGSEERVTRKLRNPNAGHTMTVAFFEILSNYRVATKLRSEEVCLVVLIPTKDLQTVKIFDRGAIRTHETALRLDLLDRTLEAGFEAARLLDSRDRSCKILCRGCGGDESVDTGSPEWNQIVIAAQKAAKVVGEIQSRTVIFPVSIPGAELGIPEAVDDIRRYLFKRTSEKNAPRLVVDIAAARITQGEQPSAAQVGAIKTSLTVLGQETLAKLKYDVDVSAGVWSEIRNYIFGTLPSGDPISAGINYGIACLRADNVKQKAGSFAAFDDGGLADALTSFTTHYDNWEKERLAARESDGKKAELARIAKEEREARILEAFGLRETADAEERLDALLNHLNDERNIDHYRFAIWNERSGATDNTILNMALSGFIDPNPVGIVGDQLAVPVRLSAETPLAQFVDTCLEDIRKDSPEDVRRHILPSSALLSEAIVGECNACEQEYRTRQGIELWRLTLDNQKAALEVQRLQARLDSSPPLLEKDWPTTGNAGHVELSFEKSSSSGK